MFERKPKAAAPLGCLICLLILSGVIGKTEEMRDKISEGLTEVAAGNEEQKMSASEPEDIYKPTYFFPNMYDSGIDDGNPYIPETYFHLLSIPFQGSFKILRVYCKNPCFSKPVNVNQYSFGVQFLDRCQNDEIRLAVYDPSDRVSTYLGLIRMKHGSNHGGIFMPLALTGDNRHIVLQAWMGSPAAGGGRWDYGYAMMPIKEVADDTTCPEISVIATPGAQFYDNYSRVVYLDNSGNMPQYAQPGPLHNSGALFFRDLIADTSSIILEEENTNYQLDRIDTVKQIINLTATLYEFSDTCPKNEVGYSCARTTTSARSIPLP
nr:hypothetical protein [candidate division Zixibacteria bacterium]